MLSRRSGCDGPGALAGSHDAVSDALYAKACEHFDEAALVDLTLLVVAINGWNRINVAARTIGGNYRRPATR